MSDEIEVKILNIDRPALISRLEQLGAKSLPIVRMKMWFYDFPDKSLRAQRITCRVRYEGENTVLYSKQKVSKEENACSKSYENPVIVSSAGDACKFLEGLGMVCNFYGEKDRLTYLLGQDHVDIDHWPSIVPDYVEVEGLSEDLVARTVNLLGYNMSQTTKSGWAEVLKMYSFDADKEKVFRF